MPRLSTFREVLASTLRNPRVRVTQGGSSKDFPGAKVAAKRIPGQRRRSRAQKAKDDAREAATKEAQLTDDILAGRVPPKF